jgi:hypothetical protein
MDWSLIIHGYPGLASVLGAQVNSELKLEPVLVENLDAARDEVRKRGTASCKLIVSGFSPALDTEVSSPVDRSTPTALDFLKEVRGKDDVPPCVLLVTTVDTARASAVADFRNVELVATDTLLSQNLSAATARLIEQRPGPPVARLDVDITLAGVTGSWHLFQPAMGFGDNGAINIDKQRLKDLVKLSKNVPAFKPEFADDAAKCVRDLGRSLYTCVLDDRSGERSLSEAIFFSTDRLKSLGNTRLRFEVRDDASKIIVETLARPAARGAGDDDDDAPGSVDELWSLRLPIFRRAPGREGNCPLFKDEASQTGPVSCLVIVGDTGEFSAGGAIGSGFSELRQANEEIDWLVGHLNRPRFELAPVTVMRAADYAEGEFAAALLQTLNARKWQLVHYTGHSQIGKEDGKAYLVLGPHRDDLLPVDTFAQHAADAQFVFLNSCNSADERFVRRLVEQNVPAVAGYTWPIPDGVAATFSKQFYQRLFPETGPRTRGFIEYAFMHARNALYQQCRGEALWTAPVLFMQTMHLQPTMPRASLAGG